MNNVRSLLFVIVSLVVANAASFITLSHNLSAGVYPVEADSIGIPLIEGAIFSVLLLVLLFVAIFIPKTKILGSATSIALCSVAALLSAASAVSWAIPHHYPMALAYAGVFAVCSFLTASYVRKLASNIAFERDARKSGARPST